MNSNNSQSRGICRRLINFIHGMLMSRTTRGSNEVAVEDGSSRNEKGSTKNISRPNSYAGSEILVEFRHTGASKGPAQMSKRGGSNLAPKKDGLTLSNDPTILQNGVADDKEREKGHFAPRIDQKIGTQAQQAQGKGLMKNITIKGSEANRSSDEATKANNRTHEDAKQRPPRSHWSLMSVPSNINQRSKEFIERRKKEMSRNYSLDHETS